ncbi:hypothetical protein M422DRAFT_57135 [Sphaerobolus stellatus SS14]|uniref:Uncharacterized protein n=1 Tax=Sphaerobolus stellatus (strain SS14) TaxID=990650 RepID=A0A0C9TL88_SPHS4|nr:hypothetical protein M422DRAFT_57135 [Sphaerobolus stellatus SS14]
MQALECMAVEGDSEDDAAAAAKQSKEEKKETPAKRAEPAEKAGPKNTRGARDQEVKESEARIGLLEQDKVATFLRAFEESSRLIDDDILAGSYFWAQPEPVAAPQPTPLPSARFKTVYITYPHYSQGPDYDISFGEDGGVNTMVADTVSGVDAGEQVDVEQPTAGPLETTHESDD